MLNNVKFSWSTFKYMDKRKKVTKNILISTLAILCMFLISLLIVVIVYRDASKFGAVIKQIFKAPWSGANSINYTICTIAIFGVAALSFLYAFRAGLFNIGISGQMMFGGIIAVLIGQHISASCPNGLGQILMLIICVIGGMFIAGIIGLLKATLNLNEVVSSIMLNWIIYFIGTWMLMQFAKAGVDGTNTVSLTEHLVLFKGNQTWIPLIILFILISIGIIVVLKYTTFGKRTVSVGMSLTSSQYMGYNVKLNQISAMLVSGAIAGVLGMMVYLGRTNSMPMNILAKSLPQDGFNGIAVGLAAMSNPVAIIPVSVFFGMIDSSKGALQAVCGIDTSISDLMFAIIVYGVAIVAIFYYFVPYRWYLRIFKGKGYGIEYDNYMRSVQRELEDTWNTLHYVRREYRYAHSKKRKQHPANSIDDDTLQKFKLDHKFNVTIYRKEEYSLTEYRKDVKEIQEIFRHLISLHKKRYIEKANKINVDYKKAKLIQHAKHRKDKKK